MATTQNKSVSCTTVILVVLILAAIGIAYTYIRSASTDNPRTHAIPQPHPYLVTYEVGGKTVVGDITIRNDNGGNEQHEISVPWSHSYRNFERGDFLYLSAQNGRDYGSITCRITVNGITIESAESTGGYVIASCSGSVK